MKSLLRLVRPAAVVAVCVSAACNAAQNVSPSAVTGPNARLGRTRVIAAHGGRFKAAYAGTFTRSGDCSDTAMFSFSGNGHSKFLHSSDEQLKLTWLCGGREVKGAVTLTSAGAPGNHFTASVLSTDFNGPCSGFTLSFTVVSGTGKFQHASGGGTIVVRRPSSSCTAYTYSDKWTGTLHF
jgi:hypothetical protein